MFAAFKAAVLSTRRQSPLQHVHATRGTTALFHRVILERMTGIEPVTSSLATKHSTAELHPHYSGMGYSATPLTVLIFGGPDGIRTRDLFRDREAC